MQSPPDKAWIDLYTRLATLESELRDVSTSLPKVIDAMGELMDRLTRIESALDHRQERIEDHEKRLRRLEEAHTKAAPTLGLIERFGWVDLAAGMGALGLGDLL